MENMENRMNVENRVNVENKDDGKYKKEQELVLNEALFQFLESIYFFEKQEKDSFGLAKVGSLRVSTVRGWLANLKSIDGKRSLSHSTIHGCKSILALAFDLAIEDNLISSNPFKFDFRKLLSNYTEKKEGLTESPESGFGKEFDIQLFEPIIIIENDTDKKETLDK